MSRGELAMEMSRASRGSSVDTFLGPVHFLCRYMLVHSEFMNA